MWVFLLIPILLLHGCGPSRSEVAKQEQFLQKMRESGQARDEKRRIDATAKAKRLDDAALSTITQTDLLTSQEAITDYSTKLSTLLALIADTEKDPLLQPGVHWRIYVEPSLNRARESMAAGLITKGKAQLQLRDFEGARNTLRQVVISFDPKSYGPYTRQAEFLLQDVEKAAAIANK